MDINDLEELILKNLKDRNQEFKRVFHGRGNFYDNFSFLTVDSIDKILFASFFDEVVLEEELISLLENIAKQNDFKTFIVQRRYLLKAPSEIVFGKIDEECIAIENALKYSINFFK